ncbi:TRAP transporter small permease [Rhodococcus sp. IEGM 1381]|uniref:TRAP transporter small permease n=1 Tax=Rhodococcus sp. IEGM 1381 TaxID=3047085 RepID=UPI0024B7810A|nr:TRAP transporter small permease [Rhodococcus sp. IEGM 1381]MDI9896159.1 TRAP transporter small permease [Rhodococcus sp. IEGM 1381]
MVHTVANALSRTVFGEPIGGTLERVQYWYMPLIVLLGFVIAMQRGEHVRADMFFSRSPDASKRYVASSASVICAVVCLLTAIYSFGQFASFYDDDAIDLDPFVDEVFERILMPHRPEGSSEGT